MLSVGDHAMHNREEISANCGGHSEYVETAENCHIIDESVNRTGVVSDNIRW